MRFKLAKRVSEDAVLDPACSSESLLHAAHDLRLLNVLLHSEGDDVRLVNTTGISAACNWLSLLPEELHTAQAAVREASSSPDPPGEWRR